MSPKATRVFCHHLVLAVLLVIPGILAGAPGLHAQTTISTGSIQGTVTDPSGAVVGGAKVSIRNKSTNQVSETTTTSSGAYTSGALLPGNYEVRVEMAGFKTVSLPVTVQVSVTATGNVKLSVGESSQVVEVQGTEVSINTEQATVQGVLTAQQIENLPINGRNFLDLAQLEPGVQIQDGGNFDPTKNGFSSISFGGRFGRTARIEVDGVDVSDETVGTTTQNIPLGAIQESSLQQSSLDLSTELTSSGSVNITTKSGTNQLHGDGFYYFRDQSLNANLPGGTDNPFQRNQYGGSLGGPVLRDKLFFFVDAERTKQDLLDPVLPGPPFEALAGNFNSPFREALGIARVDWLINNNFKAFYRFSYDQNHSVLPYIPNSFQPYSNVNHTPVHALGLDFTTGSYTHSIRFGYTKFRNEITDAVTGSDIFNPAPGIELAIGSDPNCLTPGANVFCSGPNFLAPQATFQSNRQVKYDGSKPFRNHIFRYGAGYNHIVGGGYAEFLGLAPAVGAPTDSCDTICQSLQGGAGNPLNYPVTNVTLGNGQGFSSEKPAFGFPGGGLGPDNRISLYFGDSWKVKPHLTLTYGLRYARDTGRSDSDLGAIPELEQFGAGLGRRVNQPNRNFAPQLGVAWAPGGSSKTVFRAGIGLFYENSIWNNNLYDRPARLQQGLFLASTPVCANGLAQSVSFPTSVDPAEVCGQPIGSVTSQILQLQQDYQAYTLAAGASSNPVYIGNILASGIDVTGTNMFAPDYVTPRSVQMNFGMQHEFRPGMVLTVDYLRNVGTHSLLSVDTNHVGDSRYFDEDAAIAAINATNSSFGCGNSSMTANINCAIAAGASIADYASNGLDSGYSVCGGLPCSAIGAPAAAFPGKNSAVGANQMLFPIGRSVYNGLQMSLKQHASHPFSGVRSMDLQISYALSRYVSMARDNDYINFATDNAQPSRYIGPNGLDRRHQVSFGTTMELPAHLRMSVISHFYSPLPSNMTLPVTGAPGGIFVSDVTGDGTGDGTVGSNGGTGDLLPGSNIGSFGRDISVSGLNTVIDAYNTNFAGQATPAGRVLISNGLFSLAQLQQLGGVMQTVATAPPNAVGQDWLRAFDLSLSWGHKFWDRVELRPGVSFFNLMNFANFNGSNNPFSTVLDGTPGSPNGTLNPQPASNRLGLGSGVFGLGSPRAMEFTLKLTF
ncbi:MAG: TonB-dependent receptor [Acidobacteria bacterium]|nr:TonB-dependent receptor [Acidobacteriota bacterium]